MTANITPGQILVRVQQLRNAGAADRLLQDIGTDLVQDAQRLKDQQSRLFGTWGDADDKIMREMADEQSLQVITTALGQSFRAGERDWSAELNRSTTLDTKARVAADLIGNASSVRDQVASLDQAIRSLDSRTHKTSMNEEEVTRRNILKQGRDALGTLRQQLSGLEQNERIARADVRTLAHDSLHSTDQVYQRSQVEAPLQMSLKDKSAAASIDARVSHSALSNAQAVVGAFLAAPGQISQLEPRERLLEGRHANYQGQVTAFSQDYDRANDRVIQWTSEKSTTEALIATWYFGHPPIGPENTGHPEHQGYSRVHGRFTSANEAVTRAQQKVASEEEDVRLIQVQIDAYMKNPANRGHAPQSLITAETETKRTWDEKKDDLTLAEAALSGAVRSGNQTKIDAATRLRDTKKSAEAVAHLAYDEAKSARANAEGTVTPPANLVRAKEVAQGEVDTARRAVGDAREDQRLANIAFNAWMNNNPPVQQQLDFRLANRLSTATQNVDQAVRDRSDAATLRDQAITSRDEVAGQLSNVRADLSRARDALAKGPTWKQDLGPKMTEAVDKLLADYQDYLAKGGTAILAQGGGDRVEKLSREVANVLSDPTLSDTARKAKLDGFVQEANAIAITLDSYSTKHKGAQDGAESYMAGALARLMQQYGVR